MARLSNEYSAFNKAMSTILRADPKQVKAEMEQEAQAQAAQREESGQKKRGRKPKTEEGV